VLWLEALFNFKIPVFGISYYVFVWSSQFYIKISEISFDYRFYALPTSTHMDIAIIVLSHWPI
jgi:hypothetical protein